MEAENIQSNAPENGKLSLIRWTLGYSRGYWRSISITLTESLRGPKDPKGGFERKR